jgi:hypothetical protein
MFRGGILFFLFLASYIWIQPGRRADFPIINTEVHYTYHPFPKLRDLMDYETCEL